MRNIPGVDDIVRVFHGNEPYVAHEKCAPLLKKLASDTTFLHEVIKANLLDGTYFSNKKSTVIDFGVFSDERVTMMLHCFMPLPDRSEDISHQSIHHHGNLLLTTAAVWGKGYTTVVFRPGFSVDENGTATMEIAREYRHTNPMVEFVDAFQPHIVFYPGELSITLVAWSANRFAATDRLKRLGIPEPLKRLIKKTVGVLGLRSMVNLNVADGFDFYPENGRIGELKDRETIREPRSRENYVQNVFHVLQQTGFHDNAFFKELEQTVSPEEFALFRPWIDCLQNDRHIPDEFVEGHIGIPKVNIRREELMRCFQQTEV